MMYAIPHKDKFKVKEGFALLYALLITTITLSASLIATSIIYRQFVTNNISARGFRAYAAAEDGYDCAVFWDSWLITSLFISNGLRDTDLANKMSAAGVSPSYLKCGGQSFMPASEASPPPGCSNATKFSLNNLSTDRTAGGSVSDPKVDVYICDGGGSNLFVAQGSDTGDTNNPRRSVKTKKSSSI